MYMKLNPIFKLSLKVLKCAKIKTKGFKILKHRTQTPTQRTST
jgi:hypothetical protein